MNKPSCKCATDPGFDFDTSTPCPVCGKCLRCGAEFFPHDCLHHGFKGYPGPTGHEDQEGVPGETGPIGPMGALGKRKAKLPKLQPIVGKVRNKARHRREAERVARVIAESRDLSKVIIVPVNQDDIARGSIPFFPLENQ